MSAITCLGVTYHVHEAADEFPMFTADELRELADDIKANGQCLPIIRHKGLILDGRNRLTACDLAGVEPWIVEWDDHHAAAQQSTRVQGKNGSPVSYVVALNIHRRHLNQGQKALIAAKLLPMFEAEAAERRLANLREGATPRRRPEGDIGEALGDTGRSSEHAAAAAGVSPRYVQRAKAVISQAPALAEQVRTGDISLREAEAKLRRDEQHTLIRTHRPAEGVFSVIAADPPWTYDVRADDETHRGRIPYEPMEVDAICDYLKPERCDTDCILWLWITKDHLLESAHTRVLNAWGFRPKQIYNWVKVDAEGKPRMGGGNWGRGCVEYCILAIKGNPHIDLDAAGRILNVFFAERTDEHSEKPERFFEEVINPICPHPSKLELFARDFEDAPKVRAGWVRDGVQVKRVLATTHAAASAEVEEDNRAVTEPPAFGGTVDQLAAHLAEDAPVIARRDWGPGFEHLVASLCKGDLVEVAGKKKGETAEALVDGRTKEGKLLVRSEKFDRTTKRPDGYEPTARAIDDKAVLGIVHCAPRGIAPLGQVVKSMIAQWERDEFGQDLAGEITVDDTRACWRYMVGTIAKLNANQASEVGVALREARARRLEGTVATGGIKPRPTARPPARPKRTGPLVDHGEI